MSLLLVRLLVLKKLGLYLGFFNGFVSLLKDFSVDLSKFLVRVYFFRLNFCLSYVSWFYDFLLIRI